MSRLTRCAALILSLVTLPVAASGQIDRTLGDEGFLVTALPPASTWVSDSTRLLPVDGIVDHAGRYVSATGMLWNEAGLDADTCAGWITRHLPGGALDRSFDADGSLFTRFQDKRTAWTSIAERPDGRLLVGGYFLTLEQDMLFKNGVVCQLQENGAIDTSFGSSGCVTFGTQAPGEYIAVADLAVRADGGVVVLVANPDSDTSYRLAAFTPDGVPDPAFGDPQCPNCGYVSTPSNYQNSLQPIALALDPLNGRIYIAAQHYAFDADALVGVARYSATGAWGGLLLVNFEQALGADSKDSPTDIAVAADGFIAVSADVVQADPMAGTDPHFVGVAKLRPAFALDGSFGDGGLVARRFSALSDSFAGKVAFQSDGKIVMAGAYTRPFQTLFGFGVLRFDALGADAQFGNKGAALAPSSKAPLAQVNGVAVAVTPGRIVLFGRTFDADPARLDAQVVLRFDQDNLFADSFD